MLNEGLDSFCLEEIVGNSIVFELRAIMRGMYPPDAHFAEVEPSSTTGILFILIGIPVSFCICPNPKVKSDSAETHDLPDSAVERLKKGKP